jgi:hypothetical protein
MPWRFCDSNCRSRGATAVPFHQRFRLVLLCKDCQNSLVATPYAVVPRTVHISAVVLTAERVSPGSGRSGGTAPGNKELIASKLSTQDRICVVAFLTMHVETGSRFD